MRPENILPGWRLPEGVNEPLWEYSLSDRLAETEDDYFADHPLLRADLRFLDARLVEPGPLIDLGCGGGRLAVHFARRGFPVVAVDLSQAMLRRVAAKAGAEGLRIAPVRANLCRAGCFPDGTFRYALSMFSTLGMIRGSAARQRALEVAARLLQPAGILALHAHNFWLNLKDRQGRAWIVSQIPKCWRRRPEAGDRVMTYRGIPGMAVHLYRWGELRRSIERAGLQVIEVHPIDSVRSEAIRWPWLGHAIRAGGWIVLAQRPASNIST